MHFWYFPGSHSTEDKVFLTSWWDAFQIQTELFSSLSDWGNGLEKKKVLKKSANARSGRLGDNLIAKVFNLDKLNTICWCSVFTHWGHSGLWLVLSGAHSLRAAISLVDFHPLGDHTQCATELCRRVMLPCETILWALFLCMCLRISGNLQQKNCKWIWQIL